MKELRYWVFFLTLVLFLAVLLRIHQKPGRSEPASPAPAGGEAKTSTALPSKAGTSRSGYWGKTDPNWSELHLAAWEGEEKQARRLLEGKAEVGAVDSRSRTPLHLAVEQGHTEVAKILLEHGAKVMAEDRHENTPLHVAVRNNRPELVPILLAAGADVNASNASVDSPLHIAAIYGNVPLIETLIASGAEVNLQSSHNFSPLDLAMIVGNQAAAAALRKHGGTNGINPERFGLTIPEPEITETTWLSKVTVVENFKNCNAAAAGNLAWIKSILARNPEAIKERGGKKQFTLLHCAAYSPQAEVVKYLLEQGADISARDKNGGTPLHAAADNNNPAAIVILLENGAEVDAPNNWGYTPLHYTCYDDSAQAAQALLDWGANVDARSHEPGKWTPMHVAAEEDSILTAAVLLRNGANIEARTTNGNRTPLVMALQYDQPEFADFLLAKGCQPLPPGYPIPRSWRVPAKSSGQILEEVKAKLAGGADINTKDEKGRTFLYLAAAEGQRELALFLIGKGADLNAAAATGKTPLHIAVINNRINLVGLLLQKGANPSPRDQDGHTPMYYAREINRAGFVQLLSKYKAE